ncbi:hypothetical protein ACFE04_022896 [Oxalis oulophora]
MADTQTSSSAAAERDVNQAITTLKKGSYLLKYGRRGKPKFCAFQLSTAIFQRYPRPEKEYQSFSLICHDRSLDLICKDKDEAEVWFVGLKAIISHGGYRKLRIDSRSDGASLDSLHKRTQKVSSSITPLDLADNRGNQVPYENISQNGLGKAFSDIVSYTAARKTSIQEETVSDSISSFSGCGDNSSARTSTVETMRVSLSSAVSISSQGSCQDDFDALGDVYTWGEGIGDGILGGGTVRIERSSISKVDALLPKELESTVVLDVQSIACGNKHAVLVTKHGEIFSWGEESGGRLGHGTDTDVPHPKVIDTLSGLNIDSVACGEYHTCAITVSGDLYSWGDGTNESGLLGHGSEASHWFPKRVSGNLEGMHVSHLSCGPWHTAFVTSMGQLFTFGDGIFGALGHGDRSSSSIPREVESLRELRTSRVACGVWHTAAVVEVPNESYTSNDSYSSPSGKLFTWGEGDKNRLGHGDEEYRLVPECVGALADENICKTACGQNLTIALTTSGKIYTMGSNSYGELGSPTSDGKVPTLVKGKLTDRSVEEISCGSYHVAVLTSKSDVYTWGKNTNGQLGHGDNIDRNTPILVSFLKDKQVKNVVCGSNFTAIICIHQWVAGADHSFCTGCRNPFGFRRKRHNCYNCGLVFCKACSTKKSLKAALAPNTNKPYRVCDDCCKKLKKRIDFRSVVRNLKVNGGNVNNKASVVIDSTESIGSKLRAQLSRLSSFSTNEIENMHPKQDTKLELPDRRVSAPNERFQFGKFDSLKVPGSLVGTDQMKNLSSSVPGSRMSSGATSPASGFSSPCRAVFEDPKHTNESVTQEIISLRTQVEDLTSKSKRLEAELKKTKMQLKDVSIVAENEAEKCRSAKEVVRSLTAQLKEMTERQGPVANSNSSAIHSFGVQNMVTNESHGTSIIFPERQSNGSSGNQIITDRTKAQSERTERVVQDEPGVYMTLCTLPDSAIELKRVRFSRKHFTEEQAEKWWAENGDKKSKHNTNSSSIHKTPPPPQLSRRERQREQVTIKQHGPHGKTFKKPRRPYEKERLDAELKLVGEYGLRNKRELWRVQYALSRIRNNARTLLTLDEKNPRRIFEGDALMRRMYKYGLLDESQSKLDYVLSLTVENFLERRLQTIVFKSGMAKSIHHARVLIRQKHIRVGRQVVNIPSFMVRLDSQKHIEFSLTSPFGGGRPGRVKRKNLKSASKKASGGDEDDEAEE